MSKVTIIMGSKSDLSLVEPAADVLRELGIGYEVRVLSAHRTPTETEKLASSAREAGISAIICAAGGAAHLAGAVAARTTLPVIGVPLARTPLAGQDALLATAQMPSGVPVATVAVNGAANAAILAAQIIGVTDAEVAGRLDARRQQAAKKVLADDAMVRKDQGGGTGA
ncbi:MAG TPA: 5-(carboxyamino)imidazole ribonucleotide mutase [Kofleriaceae bacterium]|nr:5-(carboxyamino)imidazole ribonucleotide mutase [Kofleriaceae bacterium]